MGNLKFLFRLTIIGALFFCACTDQPTRETDPPAGEKNKITGTILDLGGHPVSGAAIALAMENVSAISNDSGYFEIIPCSTGLPDSVLDTLAITHENYLSRKKLVTGYSDTVNVVLWDISFRLSDEISGWIDQPEYFASFDTAQLYILINGGATSYIEEGLVDGIFQILNNGTDNTCDIFLYHFGTSQKAQVMFAKKKEWISSKVLVTGYDESIVVGDEFLGGAVIYAHFGKFELELSLSGYSDIEQLKTAAKLFLQVYEIIISNIDSGSN
jgi:hypothetical protein